MQIDSGICFISGQQFPDREWGASFLSTRRGILRGSGPRSLLRADSLICIWLKVHAQGFCSFSIKIQQRCLFEVQGGESSGVISPTRLGGIPISPSPPQESPNQEQRVCRRNKKRGHWLQSSPVWSSAGQGGMDASPVSCLVLVVGAGAVSPFLFIIYVDGSVIWLLEMFEIYIDLGSQIFTHSTSWIFFMLFVMELSINISCHILSIINSLSSPNVFPDFLISENES